MSPFYTKTGDDGTTGLLGNERVSKSDLRIEVLGSLDEVSAAIGLARSFSKQPMNEELKGIQKNLYEIMSEIAATPENQDKFSKISDVTVDEIEKNIERYTGKTQIPHEFILPGDCPASGALSLARTITRRSERRLVEFQKSGQRVRSQLLKYLNRLSSLLYILELHTIQTEGNVEPSLVKKKAE
jgi:cob(I)alamin adenosyltransferase